MPSHFPQAFQALKDAAEGLITANEGVKRVADAMLAAQDDHEDLREHVVRLESLIVNLTTEVRRLRDRNGGHDSE